MYTPKWSQELDKSLPKKKTARELHFDLHVTFLLTQQNRETLGAFHSTKTSGLNFRQLPAVANETAFSKISRNENNLARYTKIFEKKISRKFSFQSTFFSEFLEFSVKWFVFRKFNSFRNFCRSSKFSKVLVEFKCCFVLVCGSQANCFTLLQVFFVSGLEIMQP